MSWFDRIAYYYEHELWDKQRVGKVVGKVLTEAEYETIIGGNYIPVENEGLGERMEELEQTVDILIGGEDNE